MTRRESLETLLAASTVEAASALYSSDGDPMRVAVMGHTGRGNYGHGLDTVWLDFPGVKVVGVSDPNSEGRGKAVSRLGLQETDGFADYEDLLKEKQPDLVAVAPRHVDEHAAMAIAAAGSGARGIYIEKPFCRNLEEAKAIANSCFLHNTKLVIAHRNRYHPVLPVVADLMANRKIGTLLEIRARGKEDHRGGCLDLWVLGSHLLNLIHYFAGDPISCNATILADGKPATGEDVVEGAEGVGPIAGNEIHAHYEMENGVSMSFDSVQGAGTKEAGFGIQFVGSGGIIDLRADREPLAHLLPGNPFVPTKGHRSWIPITSAGVGKPEPTDDIRRQITGHHAALQDLTAAIHEDRPTLCNEEDGRTVVAMTIAAFASHAQEGKRIQFPLAESGNPLAKLSSPSPAGSVRAQ